MKSYPEPKAAIKAVLQGVALNDIQAERDGYRAVLAFGPHAIPPLMSHLVSDRWDAAPKGPSVRYLAVLLAMLDAVDPVAFKREIKNLKSRKLHPLHRHAVQVMAQRRGDIPIGALEGIPVYVASAVAQRDIALARLTRWTQRARIPLDGITRVDVIALRSDMDYLGRYQITRSGIVLCWTDQPATRWHLRWLQDLQNQFTFYHEVGHHVCGHLEGGQVAKQEREANQFASRHLRRARPGLTLLTLPIWLPYRLVRKRRRTD